MILILAPIFYDCPWINKEILFHLIPFRESGRMVVIGAAIQQFEPIVSLLFLFKCYTTLVWGESSGCLEQVGQVHVLFLLRSSFSG